jgi:hypothetical protein
VASIHFYTPIVYDFKEKTRLQRTLECVDEYFYLGNRPRLFVLPPDATHEQTWAQERLVDCHRSWPNLALKIASYCTIIFPLIVGIAQYILRSIATIHSIQQIEFVCEKNDRIRAKVQAPSLLCIASFLGEKDSGKFAQTAHFARNALQSLDQSHKRQIEGLKKEIEALRPGSLISNEEFQRLVIALLNSPPPLIDHPRHWTPLMNRLMQFCSIAAEINALPSGVISNEAFQRLLVELLHSPLINYPRHWTPLINQLMQHRQFSIEISEFVHDHTTIAQMLKSSDRPIAPDRLYLFCNYIEKKLLSDRHPWVACRVFEQYMSIHPDTVSTALKGYLVRQTEQLIIPIDNQCLLSYSYSSRNFHSQNSHALWFMNARINLMSWFGDYDEDLSLWGNLSDENNAIICIPELVRDAIWTRIQQLHDAYKDYPQLISMSGRFDSQQPTDFALELAQRITNACIFLDQNGTLDIRAIEKPAYVRSNLSDNWLLENLASKHPNAVRRSERFA